MRRVQGRYRVQTKSQPETSLSHRPPISHPAPVSVSQPSTEKTPMKSFPAVECDPPPSAFYGFPTIYGDVELPPHLAYPQKTQVKGDYKPIFPNEWAQALPQRLPLRLFDFAELLPTAGFRDASSRLLRQV